MPFIPVERSEDGGALRLAVTGSLALCSLHTACHPCGTDTRSPITWGRSFFSLQSPPLSLQAALLNGWPALQWELSCTLVYILPSFSFLFVITLVTARGNAFLAPSSVRAEHWMQTHVHEQRWRLYICLCPLKLLLPQLGPWLGYCHWYSSICLVGLAFDDLQCAVKEGPASMPCRLFVCQWFIFLFSGFPQCNSIILAGWLA